MVFKFLSMITFLYYERREAIRRKKILLVVLVDHTIYPWKLPTNFIIGLRSKPYCDRAKFNLIQQGISANCASTRILSIMDIEFDLLMHVPFSCTTDGEDDRKDNRFTLVFRWTDSSLLYFSVLYWSLILNFSVSSVIFRK